jgi:hypothetical protein
MIERWMTAGDRAVCLQSVAPIRGVKCYVLDNRPQLTRWSTPRRLPMPQHKSRLLRALAITVACGSLAACVDPSGQPYVGSSYSAQVYAAPVYRGGYYGPGSGTGYGGLYAAPAYRGYYGPGSGTGYGGRYAAPAYRGYYGPGSGTGYGRYYSPGGGYYGPGSGTGQGRFWR